MMFSVFLSCNSIDRQKDSIKLASNRDTLEIIKKYTSGIIREIIYYKNNVPERNIGFNENNDSLKTPSLVSIKGQDSLFAFIPLNKYQGCDIYFGYDSIRAALGTPPDFKIDAIVKSSSIKICSQMYVRKNRINGAFRCWDSIKGFYHYYPFLVKTN